MKKQMKFKFDEDEVNRDCIYYSFKIPEDIFKETENIKLVGAKYVGDNTITLVIRYSK
jgi:hypothetical protein